MYQLSEVDGRRIINGHEIQVIGSGENGVCKVVNSSGRQVFLGTLAECEKWLRDRAMLVAD